MGLFTACVRAAKCSEVPAIYLLASVGEGLRIGGGSRRPSADADGDAKVARLSAHVLILPMWWARPNLKPVRCFNAFPPHLHAPGLEKEAQAFLRVYGSSPYV